MSHFRGLFCSVETVNNSLRATRRCNSGKKTGFSTCCTVICFLDEMAIQLEPTTAPNELLVSVLRCHLLFHEIFRLTNSRENAANEQEEHFLLSCQNKTYLSCYT